MAYVPTFGDWNAVYQTYGYEAGNAMQQQGIPLSQVGQYVQGQLGDQATYGPGGTFNWQPDSAANVSSIQNNPIVMGPQGIEQSLAGLIQFGQGGGQGQQGGSQIWPTGWQDPKNQTSLLGAQALEAVGLNPTKTMAVNPTPADTPPGSMSGVAPVSSPQYYSIKNAPMPTPSVPSVFGPVSTPPFGQVPPTQGLPTQPNYPLTGAWSTRQQAGVRPFATAPPPAQTSMPQIGAPPSAPTGPISGLSDTATPPGAAVLPAGIQNYTAGAFTTPPVNTGALPGGGTNKKMKAGGQVTGKDTDTVPAMLTPGEYVIRAPAAQAIGQPALDRMNRMHFDAGGSVPFFAGAYGMPPVATGPTNAGSDAQSWAFAQLNPQEQATLQGGGTAGQQVQQKLNQLVNQYQQGGTAMYGMGMGSMPQKLPATASQTPVRSAPAAPAGQQQPQQQPQQLTLEQWLGQYGQTSQGQAYIAQNGNVAEVQNYLRSMQPGGSIYAQDQAMYGAAPRAQLVGLPAGQGPVYDPKTYGINQTGPGNPGPAGSAVASAAGAIGQIGQNMISNAQKNLASIQPARNAIPSPADFKRQTPDIVLQGHQVGQPDVPGGYVMLAQPHDQNQNNQQQQGYNQGYLANNFG